MKKIVIIATFCMALVACNNKSSEESLADSQSTGADTGTAESSKAVEFADMKYMDIGKRGLQQLASADVDGWMSSFADNAVYLWSAGDSLAGKQAITNYWKDRRNNVMDSINFTNDIWLSVKVNQPQRGPDMPGVWLMGWYQFNVKYKNGKKVSGWIHADMHFNDKDQIDRTVMYFDRAPINAALGKK